MSPRRGAIDDRRVLETVLEVLRKSSRAHEMMIDVWQQANALRVVRREPHLTSAAKILPLSVPGAGARDRARPSESG